MLHGAGNLVQTLFVPVVWVNTLLTGGITDPLSTFPSFLFAALDFFFLFF